MWEGMRCRLLDMDLAAAGLMYAKRAHDDAQDCECEEQWQNTASEGFV